jgi:hypothetical protein
MSLMAAAGEITPMPDCAIFADTQAEPASVYRWLDWLEKQLPFPVHRVTKGNLTAAITTVRDMPNGKRWVYSGIPAYVKGVKSDGILSRQCTANYKILVIERAVRRLAGIKRGQKTVGVTQWIGISLDEAHRMKPSRQLWIKNCWPLVDGRIRRHDCLLWMERHGFPKPPRSACVYCPYHSDTEWRRLRDEEPEAFAEAVRVDKEFRRLKVLTERLDSVPFIHKSLKPLDEVDFSTDEDHGQQVMFGNECAGMCGV